MDDYPLLNLFWTMLWFFLFVAWIWLLISLVADIFRSRDLSGLAKALWILFIVVLPWVGVLVYLIARGASMADRAAEDHKHREQALRDYIRSANDSGGVSVADELTKLAQLRDTGTITADEFEAQKVRLLA